jgi:integrase/recombinase XerC/integrase/recombinase XerD
MGATVHAIRPDSAPLREACGAFLASLGGSEADGTRKTYTSTMRALRREFGDGTPVSALEPMLTAAWFTRTWGGCKPATFNRNLDAIRSAQKYWRKLGWMSEVVNLVAAIERRKVAADRSRALTRLEVEQLLTRDDISIRERTLWRMLYESAARSAEVLRLNVEDLENRAATVTRKGSATDRITWETGTERLLPRLLRGRKSGPVFLTDRKARVPLPPGDTDPASGRARLSYRRAAEIFEEATRNERGGPWTLHQLRHSRLTHLAEDGLSAPMLKTKSGHTSITSLARYANPSVEALQRWEAEHDPARRR